MSIQVYVTEILQSLAPIDGVSFGRPDDKKTWEIQYSGDATEYQKSQAEAFLRDFSIADYHKQNDYKLQRAEAYSEKSIEDQLDMIWHAMDGGKLPKNNDFYEFRKQVKLMYPKPVETK